MQLCSDGLPSSYRHQAVPPLPPCDSAASGKPALGSNSQNGKAAGASRCCRRRRAAARYQQREHGSASSEPCRGETAEPAPRRSLFRERRRAPARSPARSRCADRRVTQRDTRCQRAPRGRSPAVPMRGGRAGARKKRRARKLALLKCEAGGRKKGAGGRAVKRRGGREKKKGRARAHVVKMRGGRAGAKKKEEGFTLLKMCGGRARAPYHCAVWGRAGEKKSLKLSRCSTARRACRRGNKERCGAHAPSTRSGQAGGCACVKKKGLTLAPPFFHPPAEHFNRASASASFFLAPARPFLFHFLFLFQAAAH